MMIFCVRMDMLTPTPEMFLSNLDAVFPQDGPNLDHPQYTLPETNIFAPENGGSNRHLLVQGSIFRGYLSFREGIILETLGYLSAHP